MEKHLFELKNQVKDLQSGEGGIFALKRALSECEQKHDFLMRKNESLQKALNENELQAQKTK